MTTPRTWHRTAGVVALLVALAAVAVAGPLTSGGLVGQAAPAVTPDAPAAGLCIDESDPGDAVSCDLPHTAQIIQAWNTWDGQVAGKGLGDLKRDCWLRGRTVLAPLGLSRADPYAGLLPASTWGPPPLVVDTDIVSPPTTATSGGSADAAHPWVACVLKPRSAVTPDINSPLAPVGPYTGSIDALIPLAGRPLNLRSCYELPERLPATTSCRSWHRGEVLAVRTLAAGSEPTPEDEATCAATAATLLATDDPTRDGRLAVSLNATPAATQINRMPPDLADLTVLRCVAEATGGRFLTDSVLGLGDNPPPTN